jgi:hypothetical protein
LWDRETGIDRSNNPETETRINQGFSDDDDQKDDDYSAAPFELE